MPSETNAESHLEHHFPNAHVQLHAARLGMWIFLSTEVLLFAGLFTGYSYYRHLFPEAWAAGSQHLNLILGTVNTVVLITSSLAVAFSVHFARVSLSRAIAACLGGAILLALAFLTIKGFEYAEEFHKGALPGDYYSLHELAIPGANLFFTFYWLITGLHALHVVAGMSVLAVVAVQAWRGRYSSEWHTPVELGGMYWHLVDVIWIFVYPLLYLI